MSKDATELVAHLARQAAHVSHDVGGEHLAMIATRLVADARVLHRLAERECNDDRTPDVQAADEKKDEKYSRRVRETLKPFGVSVRFNGDPRGYPVKLFFTYHERIYNTWGGAEEGYGIG